MVPFEAFHTNPHDGWPRRARCGKQIVKIRIERNDAGISLLSGGKNRIVGSAGQTQLADVFSGDSNGS